MKRKIGIVMATVGITAFVSIMIYNIGWAAIGILAVMAYIVITVLLLGSKK